MHRQYLTRRRLLVGMAATTVTALAGCTDNSEDEQNEGRTVTVGADETVFDPADLTVEADTTVTFVWERSGHTIRVHSQPDGSDWAGVAETQEAGHEHEHTFEVAGSYEYVCEPHEDQETTGTITVEDADDDGGDGGGVY